MAIKRIYLTYGIYFVTFNTFYFRNYFEEPLLCELFISQLEVAKKTLDFRLLAFNVLPNHIHLMIQVWEEYDISKIIFSIKKNFSLNANRLLGFNSVPEQALAPVRNYAPTILKLNQFIIQNRFANYQGQKFKWKKSFWDHIIRNYYDYEMHYNYTVYNHLKHAMHESHQFTSLNYEELIDSPE